MDPVGDRRDRHLRHPDVRPEIVPHGARNLAVASTDGIAVPGQAHRQRGHVEAVTTGIVLAERQKLLPRQPELRPVEAEVTIHQVRWEDVVPGWNRRV